MMADMPLPFAAQIKDGRSATVRLATLKDLPLIVREHPLGREHLGEDEVALPDKPMRTYLTGKARVYLTTPGAGIVTGWVNDALAGFIFFAPDQPALSHSTRHPAALAWGLGQAALGRFGAPWVWPVFLRWALQHFRTPAGYASIQPLGDTPLPECRSWIGTVHTVTAFRRLGLASILLAAAEEQLRLAGADSAALWTGTDNLPAIAAFEKAGYVRTASMERIGEASWLMLKPLAEANEVG